MRTQESDPEHHGRCGKAWALDRRWMRYLPAWTGVVMCLYWQDGCIVTDMEMTGTSVQVREEHKQLCDVERSSPSVIQMRGTQWRGWEGQRWGRLRVMFRARKWGRLGGGTGVSKEDCTGLMEEWWLLCQLASCFWWGSPYPKTETHV